MRNEINTNTREEHEKDEIKTVLTDSRSIMTGVFVTNA